MGTLPRQLLMEDSDIKNGEVMVAAVQAFACALDGIEKMRERMM